MLLLLKLWGLSKRAGKLIQGRWIWFPIPFSTLLLRIVTTFTVTTINTEFGHSAIFHLGKKSQNQKSPVENSFSFQNCKLLKLSSELISVK